MRMYTAVKYSFNVASKNGSCETWTSSGQILTCGFPLVVVSVTYKVQIKNEIHKKRLTYTNLRDSRMKMLKSKAVHVQ